MGDGGDFAMRVWACRPFLLRQARRHSVAVAEDLVSDVIVQALGSSDKFNDDGTGSLKAWLSVMLRNLQCDEYRRNHPPALDIDTLSAELMPTVEPTQEVAIHLKDCLAAMASIGHNLREAVIVAANGTSIEDGADLLQIATGTYQSRLSRGRDAIAAALGESRRSLKTARVVEIA